MPKRVTDDSSLSVVTWKGDKIENDKGVDCYSQCVVNEFLLSIGDYFNVNNPDRPINVKQLDIAKIIHLYEIVDPLALEFRFQAVVESYRRPATLPEELTTLIQDLDFSREVVQNSVKFPLSLPLYSVRGKCNVMFCEPSKRVSDALANLTDIRNKRNVYICRYKIVNRNGTLALVAVGEQRATTPPKLTVSPIKILNQNSVQKVSKLNQQEIENMFSASDSETEESPTKVYQASTVSHNYSFGARRNLNSSLNDAGGDFNVLVGSIVASPHRKKNDLKMTIKMTRKEKLQNASETKLNTPLKTIQYNNNELPENLSQKQSPTKRRFRAGSPISHTPTKTPKRSENRNGMPNQEDQLTATPKSILKSFSIRLQPLTPRRSISFAIKKTPENNQENIVASNAPDNSLPSLSKSSLRQLLCKPSRITTRL